MTEVRFKQKNGYGCGVYAVANALNDESFITKNRLSVSKKGNNLYQLSRWLVKDDKKFIIEPIYMNLVSELQPLPPKGFALKPNETHQYFPFLLDVSSSELGRKHLVGCFSDSNGVVTVMDSLKDEIFKVTWDNLISGSVYNFIIGIYGFSEIDRKDDVGIWEMLEYL